MSIIYQSFKSFGCTQVEPEFIEVFALNGSQRHYGEGGEGGGGKDSWHKMFLHMNLHFDTQTSRIGLGLFWVRFPGTPFGKHKVRFLKFCHLEYR